MTDKFYVGQRVRYVKFIKPDLTNGVKVPLSACGTVTRARHLGLPTNMLTSGFLYLVKLDAYHSGEGDGSFSSFEEQIEPVCDGDTLVAWSDCAWRPKELVKV